MSGRLLAFATVLVAFVSLGIGTATAGKLPPAGGNPYSLAGGTLEIDSGTALTMQSTNDTEAALCDETGNPDFTLNEGVSCTRRAFVNYNVSSNTLNVYAEESGSSVALYAAGVESFHADNAGINRLDLEQADVGASCTANTITVDTGGATVELCFCTATNTWACWSATTTSGPTD